jgi:hypothetical protein
LQDHQQQQQFVAQIAAQPTPSQPACDNADPAALDAAAPAALEAAAAPYNPAEGEGQPGSPLLVLYKDVGASSMDAPMPPDEADRFNQLCSYNILDTVRVACVCVCLVVSCVVFSSSSAAAPVAAARSVEQRCR